MDPNAPVVDPNAPIVDPVAPVVDPGVPVADPDAPVADSEVPVADPAAPIVDPVAEPLAPVADPEAPVADLVDTPEITPDAELEKIDKEEAARLVAEYEASAAQKEQEAARIAAEQKAEAEKVVSDQALRDTVIGDIKGAAQTQEAERAATEEAKAQEEPVTLVQKLKDEAKHLLGLDKKDKNNKKDKKDKRKKSVDMSTKSDEQQSEVTDEQANAADVALQNLVQEELAEEPEKKPYLGPCGGVFGKYEVCEFEPGDSVIIDEGDTEMPSFIKESTDLPEVVIEETETVTVPLVVDNTQQPTQDATVTEDVSPAKNDQQPSTETKDESGEKFTACDDGYDDGVDSI